MTSSTELRPARQGLSLRHVRIVALTNVRFTVRTGGGLVFLFLFLTAGLTTAGLIIDPVGKMLEDAAQAQGRDLSAAEIMEEILAQDQVADMVKWVTGADDAQADYLLHKKPALVSAFYMMLLMFIPFLTCIGAFNQTAGDIGSRGLRYLLLRTERPNIYLGRFLGVVLFSAISIAFLLLVVVLYTHLKLRAYDFGDLMLWTLEGFLAALLLALPYIALCAWVSGMMSSPFASLSISLVLTGMPVILLAIVRASLEGLADMKLSWLMRFLPWGWKYDLLSGDAVTRLTAIGVTLGFTALFFFLGYFFFRKRDL